MDRILGTTGPRPDVEVKREEGDYMRGKVSP